MTMHKPFWRVRLRTYLVAVTLTGALLGCSLRWIEERRCYVRNHSHVEVWTGQRNIDRRLAELARSRGDSAGAAKWDAQAAHADGWRRVFEHLEAGGHWDDGPPVPRIPEWARDAQ